MSKRTYIEPRWPSQPFFLMAEPEGWTIGPFTAKDWVTALDGSKEYADGYTHPVTLRIEEQKGDKIRANDGHSPQVYRIVKVSDAPPPWRGEEAA